MKKQCEAEIRIKGMNFPRYRKCKRRAKYNVAGKHLCEMHHPDNMKERERKREAVQEQKRKQKQDLYYEKLRRKQNDSRT